MKNPALESLIPPTLRQVRQHLLAAALTVLLCSSHPASAWRSTLYPNNWTPPTTLSFETAKMIQDFSYAGYRRGETALPNVAGPVFNVVTGYGADPTGATDSTVKIQNAINAAKAAGGGVVYMPAGTFRVQPQGDNSYALRIDSSGIVLRGAGPTQTFLFNNSYLMRNKQIIQVTGSTSSWKIVPSGSPVPTITSNLLTPTATIPVSSVAGFAVGNWVVLRANATDAFVAEHNMLDIWGGQGNALEGVMFLRQITAINTGSKTLTVDVPIRYYLKTRDSARVHLAVPHVTEVGLENFAIGNREHPGTSGWAPDDFNDTTKSAYDVHGSKAIHLQRARNCWISNVKSYRPSVNTRNAHVLSNGIQLTQCRGVTMLNCDFQRCLYGGAGGNGYMYRLQASNECLIKDSAARFNRHGFVFSHMQCSGNVIHGGIAQVTKVQAAGNGTVGGEGNDHHMWLSQANLVDTVQLDRDYFAAVYRPFGASPHGQTAVHSVFWNLEGLAYQDNKTHIIRTAQARYGYAIGTRGAATGISVSGDSRANPVDHAEGAGAGSTLEPFSLYADQLSRRLGTSVPTAPSGLAATAVSSSQINLSWTDNSNNETGFRIERKTGSGGTYSQIATVGAGVTSYNNTGLSAGTTYFYRVRAYNTAGNSSFSNEASATTSGTVPAAPTGLTASAISSSQINLTWTDNANNEVDYRVQRQIGSGSFDPIATLGANSTSYSDTGVDPATTYTYRVRAWNAAGFSAWSNEASATTPGSGEQSITVTASGYQDPNIPENTLDDDLGTRWSAEGDGQWIKFDLGSIKTLTAVRIAFFQGASRVSYFDLETSTDNVNWTAALMGGQSSGATTAREIFDVANRTAHYVRITGHGNSNNLWNSYTVVEFVTVAATASADDGNVPENTLDGDLETRWSALGDGQWIQFDLGMPQTVTSVGIAFYNGNQRVSHFDIATSTDNSNWTAVLTGGQSSGATTAVESFDVANTTARYVRITGHGNSVNLWNSYTVVQLGTVVATATASVYQNPNIPENTLDGDLGTRWAAEGDGQWIKFDLGSPRTVTTVQIAFYLGNQRVSYFDIATSTDNVNWTSVLTGGQSSGTSTALETFNVTSSTARYVRITGHGNSVHLWNSYTAVEIQ
jgi:hypothetical protein